MIERFAFDADEIAWLLAEGVINEATAEYLRDFRFRGDIDAYPDGDLYFPGSPVLSVRCTLGEGVLLTRVAQGRLEADGTVGDPLA